eukprot:2142569-Amphidinium_carterae.1
MLFGSSRAAGLKQHVKQRSQTHRSNIHELSRCICWFWELMSLEQGLWSYLINLFPLRPTSHSRIAFDCFALLVLVYDSVMVP